MTDVHRIDRDRAAWEPADGYATMPLSVHVAGDADNLCVDLARELAAVLPWAVYGETIIPIDALPREVLRKQNIDRGAVGIELSRSQPQAEFGDIGFAGGTIRINLLQPVGENVADVPLLTARRQDVLAVLTGISGRIGEPAPRRPAPAPPAPIETDFSVDFSSDFGG